MRVRSPAKRAASFAALFLFGVACGGSTANQGSSPEPALGPQLPVGKLASGELPSKIPVESDDCVWGSNDALVTIVEFSDLECPYCARGHDTIEQLKSVFGPKQIRVVYKHTPLAIHEYALPAALATQVVREARGSQACVEFISTAYAHQKQLSGPTLVEWAEDVGIREHDLRERATSQHVIEAVQNDLRLAEQLGVQGTPSYRVNGISLEGVWPLKAFRAVVEQELGAARRLLAQGLTPGEVYARRVAENLKQR